MNILFLDFATRRCSEQTWNYVFVVVQWFTFPTSHHVTWLNNVGQFYSGLTVMDRFRGVFHFYTNVCCSVQNPAPTFDSVLGIFATDSEKLTFKPAINIASNMSLTAPILFHQAFAIFCRAVFNNFDEIQKWSHCNITGVLFQTLSTFIKNRIFITFRVLDHPNSVLRWNWRITSWYR